MAPVPPPAETSPSLEERLHAVFDAQVANFGAYNLICATGWARHADPGIQEHQGPDQQLFVVGYRRAPAELVVAPVEPEGLQARGLPLALDNTNMIRCSTHSTGLDAATVSGSTLHLEASPVTVLHTAGPEGPTETLDQTHDVADFLDFVQEFSL